MGHYSSTALSKHTNNPRNKMNTLLLVVACIGAVLPAPQYGNIGGGSAPQPQRTPSLGSTIRCRTEQTTIWDTNYVETQENVCNTEYVRQCQTLHRQKCYPTTREVCQTAMNSNAPRTTRRNATMSSELSTIPTQRRSAKQAIKKTASTTGRELETTRSGCPTGQPARTTRMTTVRMYRNSKKDKSPTQCVTRFQ